MVEAAYLPYLLVLLVLPTLAQWRWGLTAAVIVTIVELALIALIGYLLVIYHLIPEIFEGDAPPITGPEEQSRWDQTKSGVQVLIWFFIPGAAALAGGGLSVLLAAIMGIWRAVAARRVAGRSAVAGD